MLLSTRRLASTLCFDSIQLDCICIGLKHRYSLKGLNRPCNYDTPLTLAPQRESKDSH